MAVILVNTLLFAEATRDGGRRALGPLEPNLIEASQQPAPSSHDAPGKHRHGRQRDESEHEAGKQEVLRRHGKAEHR